jgi:uncharacterized small protein (DUF1192 family)
MQTIMNILLALGVVLSGAISMLKDEIDELNAKLRRK